MCDPVTAITTTMGIAQSALQASAVSASVQAESDSLNQQVQNKYTQDAYEYTQQAAQARDRGYAAEIEKRDAMGKAKARGAALGIRGTTAGELVTAEQQVGNFNVASAEEDMRNSEKAYTVSTSLTNSNAQAQHKSIAAKQPTAFESIVGMAAGGLTGYLTGTQINDSLSGVPDHIS